MSLTVEIAKRLGDFRIEVSFSVASGETLGILGPSGSGKSVTLAMIAGIMRPDEGRVCLLGETLFDSSARIDVPPQRRRVGLMFQDHALFPNMTVRENLAAVSRQKSNAIDAIIHRYKLDRAEGLYPHQISGGQRQRAALARMLISSPRAMLFDEPFSALDAFLRASVARDTQEAIKEHGGPAVLVSHDRGEISRMSTHTVIMARGSIIEAGATRDIFERPSTRLGAALTGKIDIDSIDEEEYI